MSHNVRAGTTKKFSKKCAVRAKSFFFVSESVMHYCILDVLVATTVVVAKAFCWRGGGRGYALKSSWYIRCDPLSSQDFSYKAKLGKRDSWKKEKKWLAFSSVIVSLRTPIAPPNHPSPSRPVWQPVWSLFGTFDFNVFSNLGRGGGEGTQQSLSGEAPPRGPTHYPFIFNFWRKRYPVLILTNGTLFTYLVSKHT